MLVALSLLMLVAAGARNHDPGEAALLGVLLVAALLVGRMARERLPRPPVELPGAYRARESE